MDEASLYDGRTRTVRETLPRKPRNAAISRSARRVMNANDGLPASVQAQLHNLSKSTGQDYNRLLERYALERFYVQSHLQSWRRGRWHEL